MTTKTNEILISPTFCPRCHQIISPAMSWILSFRSCPQHGKVPIVGTQIPSRCPIIPSSQCPKCGKKLLVEQLRSGLFDLRCVENCGWSSKYLDKDSKIPVLTEVSQERLLLRAVEADLINKPYVCEKPLLLTLPPICVPCIVDYIQSKNRINLSLMASLFDLTVDELEQIIRALIEAGQIQSGSFTEEYFIITRNKKTGVPPSESEVQEPLLNMPSSSLIPEIIPKIPEESPVLLSSMENVELNEETQLSETPPIIESKRSADNSDVSESSSPIITSRWGWDYEGYQIHIKYVIENKSDAVISDIKIVPDFPDQFSHEKELINISHIGAHNTRGVDFLITPKECGTFTFGGSIIYKDAQGRKQIEILTSKPIQVKCPLILPQEMTLQNLRKQITQLPGEIQSFTYDELTPTELFRLAQHVIDRLGGYAIPVSAKEQLWSSHNSHNDPIVISAKLQPDPEENIIDIEIWCLDTAERTGIFAKIADYLAHETLYRKQVFNGRSDREANLWEAGKSLTNALNYCLMEMDAGRVHDELFRAHSLLTSILDPSTPILAEITEWENRFATLPKSVPSKLADRFQDAVNRWQNEIPQLIRYLPVKQKRSVIPKSISSQPIENFSIETLVATRLRANSTDLSDHESDILSKAITMCRVRFDDINSVHELYVQLKSNKEGLKIPMELLPAFICFYYGRKAGNPLTFEDLYSILIQLPPLNQKTLTNFLPETLKGLYPKFCSMANLDLTPASISMYTNHLAISYFTGADLATLQTELISDIPQITVAAQFQNKDSVDLAIALILAICEVKKIETQVNSKYQANKEIIQIKADLIKSLSQGGK